jgi:hypothetical protein
MTFNGSQRQCRMTVPPTDVLTAAVAVVGAPRRRVEPVHGLRVPLAECVVGVRAWGGDPRLNQGAVG